MLISQNTFKNDYQKVVQKTYFKILLKLTTKGKYVPTIILEGVRTKGHKISEAKLFSFSQ